MSFTTLGLSDPILKAIKEQGYTEPTPIQKQAIPFVLSGKDLLAGAQTGTGKTAGFTLPLLERLSQSPKPQGKRPVSALNLTPTRELAAQVAESVALYGKHLPFKSTVIFGGVGINPQINRLKAGVDIVIATPGRLLDLVNQKALKLNQVEHFILDEADRMLDMGFIHDIKKVLQMLPKKRQNLLFSATFSKEIKALADQLLDKPELIEVARRNTSAETIKQVVYPVDCNRKSHLLIHLIQENDWQQVLVFTRTKHGANQLVKKLHREDITAEAIHGNKSQTARTRALKNFKAKEVRILVATDIAARGIDIDQLPHVINYELPNIPEDYVHRIGRTGRAGNEGEAASLVCIDEHKFLKAIEKLIKKEIDVVPIAGFEPDPSIKAQPITLGGGKGGQSQRRHSRGGQGRSHGGRRGGGRNDGSKAQK
jgi:ATP-dependent RNA helicase RhlE